MADHAFDKTDLIAYVTGSCNDYRRAMIEKHLSGCGACRAYCAGLEKERDTFLREHSFETTISLPDISPKKEEPRRSLFIGRRYYALAATLLVFVTVAFFIMPGMRPAGTRIKGSVGLKAFVQNRDGSVETRQNRVYRTGEKVQFLYSCGGAHFFTLFSIDSTGAVVTYYPAHGDSSVALESGQDIPLPNSIVLDEYAGRELFIGLFSKRALFVPAVRTMIADAFAAGRSMDSLSVQGTDAVIVNYACTVLPGGGK
jgi:hypothetical protein